MTLGLPFFRAGGGRYAPTEAAVGYWSPDSINGRLIVGLLGFELERLFGQAEWQPSRLTVDMFRLPRRVPIEIRARLLHEGGQLRLAEADCFCGEKPVARASIQFLKRSHAPDGAFWSPAAWDAPPPDSVPAPRSVETAHWDRRVVLGKFGTAGPRRAWHRETRELVEGAPYTPFSRAAMMADVASSMVNSGSSGLGYINSDVTLYLQRNPIGEWLGLDTVNHQSADGVAIGECWIYDEAGPIGASSVSGIAQQRASRAGGAAK